MSRSHVLLPGKRNAATRIPTALRARGPHPRSRIAARRFDRRNLGPKWEATQIRSPGAIAELQTTQIPSCSAIDLRPAAPQATHPPHTLSCLAVCRVARSCSQNEAPHRSGHHRTLKRSKLNLSEGRRNRHPQKNYSCMPCPRWVRSRLASRQYQLPIARSPHRQGTNDERNDAVISLRGGRRASARTTVAPWLGAGVHHFCSHSQGLPCLPGRSE
jgi:hypothetical protein